jgi:hypothetical protein
MRNIDKLNLSPQAHIEIEAAINDLVAIGCDLRVAENVIHALVISLFPEMAKNPLIIEQVEKPIRSFLWNEGFGFRRGEALLERIKRLCEDLDTSTANAVIAEFRRK